MSGEGFAFFHWKRITQSQCIWGSCKQCKRLWDYRLEFEPVRR